MTSLPNKYVVTPPPPHTHTHMHRVKLAVHKDTAECVAVKIVTVNGKEGLTDECLRKEVGSGVHCLGQAN